MSKIIPLLVVFVGILFLSGFGAATLNNNAVTENNPVQRGYAPTDDTTPPEIKVTWETYRVDEKWFIDFNIEVYDEESGIDKVEMYIDNGLMDTIEGPGPYEYITFTFEWSKTFKTSIFKFVAYNGVGLTAFKEIEGSDIKSYPNSQQYIQQTISIV